MTTNQRKLIEQVMSVKNDDGYDARHRGVELFRHWHRTAKSLQKMPVPQVCIEDLGEFYYHPYAFYVHNPLVCDCRETILKVPYLISFCPACCGVVKPDDWYTNIEERF